MAEKRKLLNEIDKCFKKVDEGVELFEEIMTKMQEANSDNQREKFQDDLKKEIKKLQRLRDQIKGWQNSSDIKDKDRLTNYRKIIEQRMEQFKDIERENKTKPHSKQGLSAEDKMDPREKDKAETVEWLQSQIRALNEECDKAEAQLETLSSTDQSKRRGKKEDSKKGEKEKQKKTEDLRKLLERLKMHISKLEICMRLVNNETLECKDVINTLKEPCECFIQALDPDNDMDPDSVDLEGPYEDLDLNSYAPQLEELGIRGDEERLENGEGNGEDIPLSDRPAEKIRHSSGELQVPPSPSAPQPVAARRLTHSSTPNTPLKLTSQPSLDSSSLSSPPPATPPPPPQAIPYNSVAAGIKPTLAAKANVVVLPGAPKPTSASPQVDAVSSPSSTPPLVTSASATPPLSAQPSLSNHTSSTPSNDENTAPATIHEVSSLSTTKLSSSGSSTPETVNKRFSFVANGPAQEVTALKSTPAEAIASDISGVQASLLMDPPATPSVGTNSNEDGSEDALRQSLLIHNQHINENRSQEPQTAHIPAWLGASPLGRAIASHEHDVHLSALEQALTRIPQQMDSERPRSYLPKMPCQTQQWYPQAPPTNADTLEYYLRLNPETLFFTFYYMEGSRAQLLAAKALKKLSWRFHTKYLMWFQRHEEPKQITDDYEQGTYVYFDFEKWSQRKKEQFTFEYRYLEDKEFD